MDAIAYPFRFSGGKTVKVDTETNQFRAQTIAAAMRTGKGELVITPTYGVDSPEFGSLDVAGLTYTLSTYHPDIIIDRISEEVEPRTEVLAVQVEFSSVSDRGVI